MIQHVLVLHMFVDSPSWQSLAAEECDPTTTQLKISNTGVRSSHQAPDPEAQGNNDKSLASPAPRRKNFVLI